MASTVTYPGLLKLAEYVYQQPEKIFCFNLSAPFVSLCYSERLAEILPLIDVLFANESEITSYAQSRSWTDDDIRVIISKLLAESSGRKKQRLVIITQGAGPVLVGDTVNNNIHEFPAPLMDPDEIVDTNGAGDAFVAGYLSQYVNGQTLEKCIQSAIYTAQAIIRQDGCSIPPHPPQLDYSTSEQQVAQCTSAGNENDCKQEE